MKLNVGEEVRSWSPDNRTTKNGSTREPTKRIDDIGKLTLDQDRGTYSPPEAKQTTFPASNPLKRNALTDSGYHEPPTDNNTRKDRSHPSHMKTQPGGSHIENESRAERERPSIDPEFSRTSLASSKRLFDPERDSPFSSTEVRKNKRLEKSKARTKNVVLAHVESDDFHVQPVLRHVANDPPKSLEAHGDLNRPRNGLQNTKPDRRDQSASRSTPESDADQEMDIDSEPILLLQPETRPISHEQLVVEVKGIYAGLVMVESKCRDVDAKQLNAALAKDQSRQTKLTNEQWQALIHLHKTLLQEHHDFFLASQHPSASPELSDSARRYSTPLRMWVYGIKAFLEVLRHRLPESRDHMLAFIYIAYSMVALLYETVPMFQVFWMECLGDMARYHVAAEADDPGDCEIWNGVARSWYCKVMDHNPSIGRLYHRSTKLVRQYSLHQLSLFTQSLTCLVPFEDARQELQSLFNSVLDGKAPAKPRSASFETAFIKAHGILHNRLPVSHLHAAVSEIKDGLLDKYIGQVTSIFKKQGVYAMITNIGALFEYGALRAKSFATSVLRLAYEETYPLNVYQRHYVSQPQSPIPNEGVFNLNGCGDEYSQAPSPTPHMLIEDLTSIELESSLRFLDMASELTFGILSISLRHVGDKNVYPLVHVAFVFLLSLAGVGKAMKYVEKAVPWKEICRFLNALATPEKMTAKVWASEFPRSDNGNGKHLPEDFAIRGQIYCQSLFPETWFSDALLDYEERVVELPSMEEPRDERILWLGVRIASVGHFSSSFLNSQCMLLT